MRCGLRVRNASADMCNAHCTSDQLSQESHASLQTPPRLFSDVLTVGLVKGNVTIYHSFPILTYIIINACLNFIDVPNLFSRLCLFYL